MKQKVKNINKETIYKKRRIALLVALICLIALIVAIYASTSGKRTASIREIVKINGADIDISDVINTEPNPPIVGAGMIPIKWDSAKGSWVITTKDDIDWYDYANGKWANIMLSDGKYSSELERGKILAEADTAVDTKDLGTIFTWIPRLAYLDARVEFLNDNSILDYKWTTESCFNLEGYGVNSLDLAFTGIWVGQTEYDNIIDVEAKNTAMNSKENTVGIIANEKVNTLTSSDKTAVEKLFSKYSISENETTIKSISTMANRQTIKIVNTNKRIPLAGTCTIVGNDIQVGIKYQENMYQYSFNKNGDILAGDKIAIDEEEIQYTFYLVDSKGNIRRYPISYGGGRPYLKGFNKSNTFYVVYDNNGNEASEIPIGETAPNDWYDYNNQRWANIVVRDNGNISYYTWIPRYMYKLDNANQKVIARIVDLENKDVETGKDLTREGYILPDAFTWEDPDNASAKTQLTGFWASKYKLREGTTEGVNISGGSGVITVNNISEATNSSYICEMYLIKDGKRIVFDTSTLTYKKETTPEILTGNYRYNKLEVGNYSVNIIIKDTTTNLQVKAITKQVDVTELIEPNAPDLTGFNKNNTFYVVYDDAGNEASEIPIGETAPNNWYDYTGQRWANIVVRDNSGNVNYFTWIPRYEYKLDTNMQKTNAIFITTDKVTADAGYTIPDAFTWEYEEGGERKKKALAGFWASKYKLREGATDGIDIAGASGIINVNNIAEATNSSYTCEMYLIKDGQRIGNPITLTGNYRYTDLVAGNYSVNIIVKNATTNVQEKAITKQIDVTAKIEPNAPDLTGFNKNNTFYVVYDDAGNASEISINDPAPSNWYDYTNQKWANIVVRDDKGNVNYFTWIPRYEYKLDTSMQKTNAVFIPTDKIDADDGYTIPDAFTWEYEEGGETKKKALAGFWASKYKLREGIK